MTAVWESQKNVPECKWDWCYCNSCLTGLFCILQNFLFLLHYFQHVSCIAIVEKYCTFMTVSVVYWLPTVFVAKCILVSEVPNNDSELHSCQSGEDRKWRKEVSFEKSLCRDSLILLIPELVKWPFSFPLILPLSLHTDKFIFLGQSLYSSFPRGAVVDCLVQFKLFFIFKVSNSCFNFVYTYFYAAL